MRPSVEQLTGVGIELGIQAASARPGGLRRGGVSGPLRAAHKGETEA